MEGQEISMATISQSASISSGSVHILHPLELMRQIRLISQNPVVATDTEVTIVTQPGVVLGNGVSASTNFKYEKNPFM